MTESAAIGPVPEEKSDDTSLIAVDGSLISEAKVTPNWNVKSLSKTHGNRFEEGYDSDSGCGPFYDCIDEEEDQVFNKVELPELRRVM